MIISNRIAAALNPRYLRLIILPTEKCNFRCTYCYESFELGRMSSTTINALVSHIRLRIPRLDHLQISWFGGEPLLAMDSMLRVSAEAKQLCESNGASFNSDITTNGYLLTPDVADQLFQAGIRDYQITLDGLEGDHDQTRLLASGAGTFHQIYANLRQLLKTSLSISLLLRLHYSGATAIRLPEFSRFVVEEFGHDPRVTFSLKEIEALGGKNDGALIRVTSGKQRSALGIAKRLLSLEENPTPQNAESYCYAGSANSYVVRSNGRISKCTVAFNDDRNDLGQLKEDGTLLLNQKKARAWTEAALSGEPGAMECPLHFLGSTGLQAPATHT